MPKIATLSNGSLLVGLDQHAQIYDLYYPHVGLENHTAGRLLHKVGIFVDGSIAWMDHPGWKFQINHVSDSMTSNVSAFHEEKNISISFEDCVYNEKNIFIRHITIHNHSTTKRTIKLYMNHQFEIYEAHRGDTAMYDPHAKVLIHYKGRRVFLMNCDHDVVGIDDYSVGLLGIEGHEGTYVDAEDGKLEQNPIEHGFVDSVFGCTCEIKGGADYTIHYWMCIGKTLEEAHELNVYVLEKTAQYLLQTTQDYWKAWVNKQGYSFEKIDERLIQLFKQSLLIVRAHIDDTGAIIASSDSDLLKQGRDYYNYMWPRDGALTACALQKAGYSHVTRKFFRFCTGLLTQEGYLRHKYRPDGSMGASWHPWVQQDPDDLPIQEDETALVLFALGEYYESSKDLELIESLYNSCIKKSAEFMVSYMDTETGLPLPSYDLWEEKYGISTFTAGSVYAGLMAASKFAGILGKSQNELKYRTFAEKIKKAILDQLYDEKEGYFYKRLYRDGKKYRIDTTCDISSVYAMYHFGLCDVNDEKVTRGMAYAMKNLSCDHGLHGEQGVGGYARYVNDAYFRASTSFPGNPWIISTLWVAQYFIAKASTADECVVAYDHLKWVSKQALESGILPEQVHPITGEHISASPLTWSHAEYIQTLLLYMEKMEKLGVTHMYAL